LISDRSESNAEGAKATGLRSTVRGQRRRGLSRIDRAVRGGATRGEYECEGYYISAELNWIAFRIFCPARIKGD
jgi:hypothetical protein